MKMRPISQSIYQNLCALIPGGVNSPVRSCKEVEQLPMVVDRAAGDLLFDADNLSYIDFCCSWGALIHGHAHPQILEAIQKRAARGTSFGVTSAIEGQLAAKIIELVPSVEKIRFVSSGTEATMSAVRLARGFTGRDLIVKFGGNYHGHADFFLVQAGSGVMGLSPTSSSAGIPDEIVKHTLCLRYNDTKSIHDLFQNEQYRGRIAAVIVEPIAGNIGVVPAKPEFLQALRDETAKAGALLILDEVISGFRIGLSGAQGLYGIKPDLTCFGKIMGGGFPAAAFGGRAEVMNCLAPLGPVYQAGTLSGNPVAMEAGLQALTLLQQRGFYEELERKALLITEPVREALKKRNDISTCLQRAGSMFTLFFGRKEVSNMEDARALDLKTFGRFFRFMFENGVYIPPSQHEAWFISSAHEERNLNKTRDLILQFIDQMR